MIRFSLSCAEGHQFESWFQSSAAFDKLAQRNMVLCPVCGGDKVSKALMTPSVAASKKAATPPVQEADDHARLAALRAEVESRSDYVGPRFVQEARAMYLGDIPSRAIYGEAPISEAKALIDEGVPVLPLPFVPSRKLS